MSDSNNNNSKMELQLKKPEVMPASLSMTDEEWNALDTRLKNLVLSICLYDVVIDINSIRFCPQGYSIYYNLKEKFDLMNIPIRARMVTLVGPFNSGKTKVISWLSGRELMSGTNISTNGLSLIIQASLLATNSASATKQPAPEVVSKVAALTRTSTPKKSEPPKVFVFLDTAGTSVPCHQEVLKDVRSTESLLRELITQLSTRVIYVTPKFDRETQIAINALCLNLSNLGKKGSLICIHNYRDVRTPEELQFAINRVQETYEKRDKQADDEAESQVEDLPGWSQKVKTEEEEEMEEPEWEPVEQSKATFYNSKRCTHVFLMDDNTPYGKEHNSNVIDALKLKLENDDFETLSLMKQILKVMTTSMTRYLESWNQDCSFGIDEQSCKIIPRGIDPSWKALKLARISFSDTGIISEHLIDLEGNMYLDEAADKIIIKIKVPGLSQEHSNQKYFHFDWNDTSNADLTVNLKKPNEPPQEESNLRLIHQGYKYGIGVFRIKMPEGVTFKYPDETDLYDELMVINNGELRITLDRERKPNERKKPAAF